MTDEMGALESSSPPELAARRPVVAILENIRSAGNVGSMFRSADATLLERLYICGYTAHPPHPEMEKTALGACESVPWEFWGRAGQAVEWLQARGYMILALEQTPRSQPLDFGRIGDSDSLPWSYPLAFVVGNEVTGVSETVLELCDLHVSIPMLGMKDSLNVAVAFGIAAYGLTAGCAEA